MYHLYKFSKSLLPLLLALPVYLTGQSDINIKTDELWWGGSISATSNMPLEEGYNIDLRDVRQGVVQPLYLSSKGRYIWSEQPFPIRVQGGKIKISSDYEIKSGTAGKTLRDAYDYAIKNFIKVPSRVPDASLLNMPMYHLGSYLGESQSQYNLLGLVKSMEDQGYPKGIIVIEDGWQQNNGSWTFRTDKFPDAADMINILHEVGYKVMVTVNPFCSPDSDQFRRLAQDEDVFIKDETDPEAVKIVQWKNGYSALFDLGNNGVASALANQLTSLSKEIGVDGYVFDEVHVGDLEGIFAESGATACDLLQEYAELSTKFSLNTFSSGCNAAGTSAVVQVPMSEMTWSSLRESVPQLTGQALLGVHYTSLAAPSWQLSDSIDYELAVRYAQLQAMLPSSAMPYLPMEKMDPQHKAAFEKALQLKGKNASKFEKILGSAALDGTPVICSMQLAYPTSSVAKYHDQFMIGDKILVAPILVKGQKVRKVRLPEGIWLSSTGKGYQGPMDLNVRVALDEIPYFEKAVVKRSNNSGN